MRARDARALAFCVATTSALFLGLLALTQSLFAAGGLALAYAVFVFTRPRMIRVFARVQGVSDWSGYYTDR